MACPPGLVIDEVCSAFKRTTRFSESTPPFTAPHALFVRCNAVFTQRQHEFHSRLSDLTRIGFALSLCNLYSVLFYYSLSYGSQTQIPWEPDE